MRNLGGWLVQMLMRAGILFGGETVVVVGLMVVVVVGVMVVAMMGVMSFF